MWNRLALFGLLALGACQPSAGPSSLEAEAGSGGEEPASDDAPIGGCAPGMVGALMAFTQTVPMGTPSEIDAAQAAYDAGALTESSEQYVDAAGHFLDCARAYRTVPDTYDQIAHVIDNARTCYAAAATMWGNAGRFASDGRAALERAAAEDPRLADSIRSMLADPPYDCVP